MEKGFFHPDRGYWQTVSEPSQEIIDSYPEGTVEVPLKPDADYDWQNGAWVHVPLPEPTPEELRALMPKLEKWRVHAAINLVPGLREKIDAAIDRMPEPTKTISRSKFDNVVELDRLDPLFDLIGGDEEVGFSPEDIDEMWLQAAEF